MHCVNVPVNCVQFQLKAFKVNFDAALPSASLVFRTQMHQSNDCMQRKKIAGLNVSTRKIVSKNTRFIVT